MEDRIRRIQEQGTPAEIGIFDGLSHGFALGEGTGAEKWIERASDFFTLPGYEGLYLLGVTNQHGGGGALFSQDEEIMGWLFGEHTSEV